jgi:hypothetical protein
MRKGRFQLALVAPLAIAVGALLAFALPAGAAVSVQSESQPSLEVTLGATALLDAKGAVVYVPVTVVCQPASFSSLVVQVTQRVGSDIASGVAYTDVDCTGSVQELVIAVTATQNAFRKGVAFGRARLDVCAFECVQAVDQHNVEIVRK